MKRAIAMAMLASTLLTGLAMAQPSSHPGKAPAKANEAGNDVTRSMDAPYLAVPVVRDGRLVNYLFVSIRVDVAQGVDLWRTREKAHFLRDALIRAAYSQPLTNPNAPNTLDEARAIAVFRAAAIQTLGERAVGRVSIVSMYSSGG